MPRVGLSTPATAFNQRDYRYIEPALRPYDWYKALVVAGAIEHSLPPAYVEWIRTFHSQPDPNVMRRAKNERLLFSS